MNKKIFYLKQVIAEVVVFLLGITAAIFAGALAIVLISINIFLRALPFIVAGACLLGIANWMGVI